MSKLLSPMFPAISYSPCSNCLLFWSTVFIKYLDTWTCFQLEVGKKLFVEDKGKLIVPQFFWQSLANNWVFINYNLWASQRSKLLKLTFSLQIMKSLDSRMGKLKFDKLKKKYRIWVNQSSQMNWFSCLWAQVVLKVEYPKVKWPLLWCLSFLNACKTKVFVDFALKVLMNVTVIV